MTTKELIDVLSTHPPDLEVMVDGYEGGLNDLIPAKIIVKQVARDVNGQLSYMGSHDYVPEWEDPTDELSIFYNLPLTPALLLRR